MNCWISYVNPLIFFFHVCDLSLDAFLCVFLVKEKYLNKGPDHLGSGQVGGSWQISGFHMTVMTEGENHWGGQQ